MAPAWLDSLSEDWVSQPGSDNNSFAGPSASASASASATPAARTPARRVKDPKHVETPTPPSRNSRIPRLCHSHKKSQSVPVVRSSPRSSPARSSPARNSPVLNERSVNEKPGASSRPQQPSKLSQEVKLGRRGRGGSRSASTSSVVHNTVNHKSVSASPSRRRETPEWKRRLVYGDLSYGEQPDLFTSAATGLENIFKPPAPAPDPPARGHETPDEEPISQYEVTLPSSPPQYRQDPSTVEIHVDESVQQSSEMPERRAPTSMRYRRNDDDSAQSDHSLQEESYSQQPTVEQTALSLPQEEGSDLQSRKVSGQSVVRNEDFSPILLERRQASNGEVGFGPSDLPPDELRKRLEKLQINQMVVGADVSVDSPTKTPEEGNSRSAANLDGLGGFVNFRRGGRSEDGSFRQHMLSSALNDTSELNPEESLQASTPKQFPTVRVEQWGGEEVSTESPDYPRPPDPSPEKRTVNSQGSAGSPLKLFQPYDTFTNQTMLRRLSQFEGQTLEETPSRAQGDHSVNEDPSYMTSPPRSPTRRGTTRGRNISQFGAGELDGYEFHDEFSYEANGDSMLDADKENCGPDGESVNLPRAPIFNLTHASSPDESDGLVVRRSRQKPLTPHPAKFYGRAEDISMRVESRLSVPLTGDVLSTPLRADMSDIKRPRTSPSKDPTPKRRRTLHKSDVGYELFDQSHALDSVQQSHLQMQSALTGPFDDAQGNEDQHDGPEVDIIRPRTPTPHQRSSVQRERQPLAEIEMSPSRTRHSQSSVPPQLRSVIDSERKPSIKTEDFMNEANKIMAMIRSKAGVASGLASLDGSGAEDGGQPSPDLDSSYQSTQEPFSRPPSREGRPPIARVSARQEDPELAERLKKYEEPSDNMGDLIGSSMRSNALSAGTVSSARESDGENWKRIGSNNSWPSNIDGEMISDPPNIRLSRNPDRLDSGADAVPTHSSGHSTGRSYPTGSSRSENRKTIAPESVEHLIPDKVGNMVLDRQRNIWIKRKSGSSSGSSKGKNFLPSEASEDDPFADIPDLSVDMTMELQNLMATRAENAAKLAEQEGRATSGASQAPSSSGTASARRPFLIPAPNTSPVRNQNPIPAAQETPRRAGNDTIEHEIGIHEDRVSATRRRNLTISFSSPIASIIQDVVDEHLDGWEEDQSVLDQSYDDMSRESVKRGRRIISVQVQNGTSTARSRSDSRGPARHLSVRGQTLLARPISRIDEREEESAFDRARARQQRRQEASGMELSIIADNNSSVHSEAEGSGARRASLGFLVATPARPTDCPAENADGGPIISQFVGTYSLSPLSEFTIHKGEETLPLEASYVVGNHRLVTGDRSKRVMSMNTRDLVEKLAEVEPFEPYWEDMRELKLANKRLASLHALHEFCSQLEMLDVSHNEIRNLVGIPETVRQLKITNNQLSSLTAWNHLIHLQYIDVSNNGITSLAPFKNLVHLRSLRADNNQITSLDGIKFHDALLSLRARGNPITELDFESNKLDRLTELDLKNNKIKRVKGLQHLSSISSLNLEGNQLESFTIESSSSEDDDNSPPQPLYALRYLRLDDNKISNLDIKMMPHLRLLHADRNRIVRINGFSRARKVDSLSLREQSGETPLDLDYLLSRAYEVRKLYLSGNYFGGDGGDKEGESTFSPTIDMLNLQLLELANCGLASLPENLGLMLPNLRVLNLNFNALSDLGPLVGVPRLKRVFVSGNRLADCAKLVRVLAGFECLTAVDVRDNPGTVGFYAPLAAMGMLPSWGECQKRQRAVNDKQEEGQEADEDKAVVKSTGGGTAGDKEPASVDPFTLPDQDPQRDRTYCKRLDMETRMRRRVYEQMFVGCCKRLKKLDGLSIDGRQVASLRDGVWLALAEKGFVVERRDRGCQSMSVDPEDAGKGDAKAEGTESEEGQQDNKKKNVDINVDESTRWGAEDSFGGY